MDFVPDLNFEVEPIVEDEEEMVGGDWDDWAGDDLVLDFEIEPELVEEEEEMVGGDLDWSPDDMVISMDIVPEVTEDKADMAGGWEKEQEMMGDWTWDQTADVAADEYVEDDDDAEDWDADDMVISMDIVPEVTEDEEEMVGDLEMEWVLEPVMKPVLEMDAPEMQGGFGAPTE